jgi:hypothetical protein
MDEVSIVTGEQPSCPLCGAEALLSAMVPHGWSTESGRQVQGRRTALLCPQCHRADPAAGALIDFFAIHGSITPETVEVFAIRLQTWVDHVSGQRLDIDGLNAEIAAWQNGDL